MVFFLIGQEHSSNHQPILSMNTQNEQERENKSSATQPRGQMQDQPRERRQESQRQNPGEESESESDLSGKRVAILATDGFEQDELLSPLEALKKANADVKVVSPTEEKIKGWKYTDWGTTVKVDVPLHEARTQDFDALVLPGGVINPDHLRREPAAVNFVKEFMASGKPVAAICHGPQMLIEAGAVRGRKLTSFPSIRTDLQNAGAEWVDEEVVVDNGLVTSRSPDDLAAFNAKMIEEFAEGEHEPREIAGAEA
jgi:protease I